MIQAWDAIPWQPQRLFTPARPWPFLNPKAGARLVFTDSARTAIFHALTGLGLNPPGKVLVPAYHCGSEVSPIEAAGFEPVFYRVGEDLSFSVDDLEEVVTPRTKAVHLTHFFGFPGPAPEVAEWAASRKIALIEDCAHGLFSSRGETPLGSFGQAAVFSLPKSLALYSGGVLRLAEGTPEYRPKMEPPSLTLSLFRLKRMLGPRVKLKLGRMPNLANTAPPKPTEPPFGEVGYDPREGRLCAGWWARRTLSTSNWQGLVQRRRANYRALVEGLADLDGGPVRVIKRDLEAGVCPWMLPLRVKDPFGARVGLRGRGIGAVAIWAYYYPGYDPARFPEATALKSSVLGLPVHQGIGPEEIGLILDGVRAEVGS